jgi:hypothetical protein
MNENEIPAWLGSLETEDVNFIKKFVLASGSLKELAGNYNVTYPTIRLRLDRLIQKIKVNENDEVLPYVALIKKLAIDEKIELDAAKILINEFYRLNKGDE